MSTGTWTEIPRQPKQKRCHECGKRTFYWLLEPEGAICSVCVNLRTMPKPTPQSAPTGESTIGKKSKSTMAPTIKNAIIAKRASGQSKLSIAKEMHVAPGTVRNVLNEADFDQLVQEGRFEVVKLTPRAIAGLGKAMDKGDGPTCNRFLENVGVLGENKPRKSQGDSELVLVIKNLMGNVQVNAPQGPTINAEVVSAPLASGPEPHS